MWKKPSGKCEQNLQLSITVMCALFHTCRFHGMCPTTADLMIGSIRVRGLGAESRGWSLGVEEGSVQPVWAAEELSLRVWDCLVKFCRWVGLKYTSAISKHKADKQKHRAHVKWNNNNKKKNLFFLFYLQFVCWLKLLTWKVLRGRQYLWGNISSLRKCF